MGGMRLLSAFVIPCAMAATATTLATGDPVVEARTVLEKWVETRQLISSTRADWQSAQQALGLNAQLFQQELRRVREQTEKLSTNNTQVAKEQDEASRAKRDLEDALKKVRDLATDFESRVRNLLPGLPAPLQQTVQPLAARIPTDENTRLSAAERIQTIVGILNEVDKFNSAVTVTNERRGDARGDEVNVDTIYLGLAVAYFVEPSEKLAGFGAPTADGWKWTIDSKIAPQVKEMIAMYRNQKPAGFVSLPIQIQ
jgi:hypothetical protein